MGRRHLFSRNSNSQSRYPGIRWIQRHRFTNILNGISALCSGCESPTGFLRPPRDVMFFADAHPDSKARASSDAARLISKNAFRRSAGPDQMRLIPLPRGPALFPKDTGEMRL